MKDIFSTREENKKIAEEQKKEYSRRILDIKKVLELPQGRRVLWWVLSLGHIYRISFNLNTKMEDFAEGERNIALQLLSIIEEADSTAYAQMKNEYISEKKSKEAVKEKEKQQEEQDE